MIFRAGVVIENVAIGRRAPCCTRFCEPEPIDPLKGVWKGRREYHIEPDWLLIYEATDTELVLLRTGTHADLFDN